MSDILCFIVDELNLTNKDLLDSVQKSVRPEATSNTTSFP